MDERQPAPVVSRSDPTGRDHVFLVPLSLRNMLEIFDILQEPKFWVAMAFGLAPIVIGIIILRSRR